MKRLKNLFGAGRRGVAEPALPLDLTDESFVADPAPVYGWLRKHRPLCELASGGFLLTRHADIAAALSDPILGNAPSRFSVLSARNSDKYSAAELAANIPPFLDKPDHIPIRRALSQAFFRTLESWAKQASGVAALVLNDSPDPVQVDLVSKIARPFAARFMAGFVGLPYEPERIGRTSAALFDLFAPTADRSRFDDTNRRLSEARSFIGSSVARARGRPRDDLISHLCAWQDGDSGLSDAQVADNAILVLADGIENIEAAIAMSFGRLARQPEVRRRVARSEIDMQVVVRECLRLSTPGQVIPRVTRESGWICGKEIAEGTPVFLALGSANLDGTVHEAPDVFRLDRDVKPFLIFGHGRHRCIGEPLALVMIGAMLKALLDRGADPLPGPIRYHARFGHRWPLAVPVRLGASTPRG